MTGLRDSYSNNQLGLSEKSKSVVTPSIPDDGKGDTTPLGIGEAGVFRSGTMRLMYIALRRRRGREESIGHLHTTWAAPSRV